MAVRRRIGRTWIAWALALAALMLCLPPERSTARSCLSKQEARADARIAVQEVYGRPGRVNSPLRRSCQRWTFSYRVGIPRPRLWRYETGTVEIKGLPYGYFHYRFYPTSGELP
jgi:hypothetical protein